MTQLGEAIARYHKLIQSEPYKDLSWVESLREQMAQAHLTPASRPIVFLRPHFLTRRQYEALVKAAETLLSAIERLKQMALSDPALLARIELLPAEKMLAAIDPGYPFLTVTSLLDTHLNDGSIHCVDYNADTAASIAQAAVLADLFYECSLMKQFRRQHKVSKLSDTKHLVHSVLTAYKEFGGKRKPRVGVLEFRQPFQSAESSEDILLCEIFRNHGCPAAVVAPDQLEYKQGVLRQGEFVMDLVFRRVKVHEFLLRFDLSHPLVRAYRDRAVCVVNSFRSELADKKAIFALLTDESVTAGFPAAEKKAIREFVPWTRVVAPVQTTYQGKKVDLLDFILKNREKLVLKPNDDSAEQHSFRGWQTNDAGWERALRVASRNTYVVQERVEPVISLFPLFRYGQLEMKELQVDVYPHAYLGKIQGCSTWLTDPNPGSFSSVAGLTPTYILENKS
jgi:hypothetical protein